MDAGFFVECVQAAVDEGENERGAFSPFVEPEFDPGKITRGGWKPSLVLVTSDDVVRGVIP